MHYSALPAWLLASLFWDDRQQQVGLLVASKMQACHSAKYISRPVKRVIMQERTASLQLVLEIRQSSAACPAVFVILAADADADTISGRHDDGRRPDLDIQLRDFAWPELLFFVVGVVGTERPRQFLVELAVRGAQPALRDRSVRVDGALEDNFFEVRREHPHDDEQISIVCRRRDEQLERRRSGDLRFGR